MSTSLSVSVTEDSYNIVSNTSVVKIVVKVTTTGDSHNLTGSAKLTVKVGGSTLCSSKSVKFGYNSTTTIYTGSKTVSHNADGTGSCAWSVKLVTDISAGTLNKSGTKTLTTIPRTSSVTLSSSSLNLGDSQVVSIARNSTSFTHTIQYSFDNSTYTDIATGIDTSYTWAIPYDIANKMGGSDTSKIAYIRVITYNGSTQIGSEVKTFTLNVPNNVNTRPRFDDVYVSQVNLLPWTILGFVQGLSDVCFIPFITYMYGASIKNITLNINGTTILPDSDWTFTTKVYDVGTLLYTITVTDTRGFSNTYTNTIEIIPYKKPTINSITVTGSNNTLNVKISGSISSVNSQNSKQSIVEYRNMTDRTYLSKEFELSSYDFSETLSISPAGIDVTAPSEVIVYVYDKNTGTKEISKTYIMNAFISMSSSDMRYLMAINTSAKNDGKIYYYDYRNRVKHWSLATNVYTADPMIDFGYANRKYIGLDADNKITSGAYDRWEYSEKYSKTDEVYQCNAFGCRFFVSDKGKVYLHDGNELISHTGITGVDNIIGCAGNDECMFVICDNGDIYTIRSKDASEQFKKTELPMVIDGESVGLSLNSLSPLSNVRMHMTPKYLYMVVNTNAGTKFLCSQVTTLR